MSRSGGGLIRNASVFWIIVQLKYPSTHSTVLAKGWSNVTIHASIHRLPLGMNTSEHEVSRVDGGDGGGLESSVSQHHKGCVTMATRKQSFVRACEPQCSVSAQLEDETHAQAPLTTMYVQSIAAPSLQTLPLAQPGALQDAPVLPVFLPGMCSTSALASLTVHIASTAALHQQRLVDPASSSRPKSTRKHVCQHCGKDCLKPSVLEKHLRCHTGERPYPCTTCGISFKTQSNLYKHKRTQAHARVSGESDRETFSSQESTESLAPDFDSGGSTTTKEVVPEESVTTPASKHSTCSAAPREEVSSTRRTAELSVDVKSALRVGGCAPADTNRSPLQRQEALFSKPSFPFFSNNYKSQSHDSTDSGFSDGSEQHSFSSGSSLGAETSFLEPSASQNIPESPSRDASNPEKQKLEERISKLIYENSVLVEDKKLENVRPRKTVLSKQGSIDLPMPYTYKDSFHFEMRNSKHIPSSLNHHSTVVEHAPLTRSSSLPFTVFGKPADDAGSLNLSRRCSAGHLYSMQSSDQKPGAHRSLVRQAAVDCSPSPEVSPVERGSVSSLSFDGEEPCGKANYRKKAPKFDYTKWHTYKGGTFRKLYNTECPLKARRSTLRTDRMESLEIHISKQSSNEPVSLSFPTSRDSRQVLHAGFESFGTKGEQKLFSEHIPSERKKQRTGNEILSFSETTQGHRSGTICHSSMSKASSGVGAVCLVNTSGPCGVPSGTVSIPTPPETKSSFPPVYQLKIPTSTDVSSSCSTSTFDDSALTSRPKECNSDSSSRASTFAQNKQECTSGPASGSCAGLNQINTSTKAFPQLHLASPTQPQASLVQSSRAAPPALHLENPLTVGINASRCSPPTKPPAPFPELGRALARTTSTASEKTPGGSASSVQEPRSEGQLIFADGSPQAQNMFYVCTGDLQIVMQLISDEQLALIEPHIETNTLFCSTSPTPSKDVCAEKGTATDEDALGKNTETEAVPQSVSSWSRAQTPFHASDYCRNPGQELYEPQKIPEQSKHESETCSDHNSEAISSVEEQTPADKSSQKIKISAEPHETGCLFSDASSGTTEKLKAGPSSSAELNLTMASCHDEAGLGSRGRRAWESGMLPMTLDSELAQALMGLQQTFSPDLDHFEDHVRALTEAAEHTSCGGALQFFTDPEEDGKTGSGSETQEVPNSPGAHQTSTQESLDFCLEEELSPGSPPHPDGNQVPPDTLPSPDLMGQPSSPPKPTQSDFQKETPSGSSATRWIYTKSAQVQHKVLCASQTESSDLETDNASRSLEQASAPQTSPAAHSSSSEHYLRKSGYLDHEDGSSSSSDDEQKLVIELE
ncbi:hypothetical protein DNTS_008275 [Danionella cerebrum]|uniref:C2H2-type domain-containing protein n=1 Tax=Danionella cerebrum TaxID=2873325 RepID=A0A553R6H1_9TELE|nr:hypothetical protein DNTS_008275 [Danionella translucida]TRY97775.1 hypothetical protein DNTS_008275 [Danionella translucida]